MQLVKPCIEYRDSFILAMREFQLEGRNLKYSIDKLEQTFEVFLSELQDRADKAKLKAGTVPETILWLVDDNEFVGRLSIRHELNERLLKYDGNIGYEIRPLLRRKGYGTKILELGLKEAKKLGLSSVLITCDSDNAASKRIIEANGGVLENEAWVEDEKKLRLRYWINQL